MEFDFTLIFFVLFIAEQVAMVKLGSYPYFWGIPFARRKLPKNLPIEDVGGLFGRLKIKNDQKGNIFFRYKHFPLSWGPYVFVGQVKNEDPTELIIRLGPLTCLFFVAFIIEGIFSGFLSSVVALVTVSFFLNFFFNSFQKGYEKILSKVTNKI